MATTLFGVLAGHLLRTVDDVIERTARLFVLGSLLAVAGHVWSWSLPLNKALWTSSYSLFTAGLATCALALCVWFFDRGDGPMTDAIARPLIVYGKNALAVFVGSSVAAKTLLYLKPGGTSLHAHIFENAFAFWLPPYVASLAFAIAWVLGWYLLLWSLDRRGVVIKV